MRKAKLIVALIVGSVLLAGCGLPPVCGSYSPYELDWQGYNSVTAFKKYFRGYEQTILEHLGDTVRVYGCLCYKYYGTPVHQESNRYVLATFFDDSTGMVMFIENPANIEVPLSFYDKTLYVTGGVLYHISMGCKKGVGLELISVDTIPHYVIQ